ncbi:MAG: 50S ribosome-binding GTPase [Bacteroidales bacterium]|nr:50S ribosome-binding GTPase [Bacteroidales bacterium]
MDVVSILETLNKNLSEQDKDLLRKLTQDEKDKVIKWLSESQNAKANILITGATGCGKSSTINALFCTEKAIVGTGADPMTMDIQKYDFGNLVIWDSPGLGDSPAKDELHKSGLIKKLEECDEKGNFLIDVVLVILDGSSRDMGTSFDLIKDVIVPHLGKKPENRLIIGVNKVDSMMSGRHWDVENTKPDSKLEEKILETENTFRERINDACNHLFAFVSYSAGYKEDNKPQEPSYNIANLLLKIIDSMPSEKRVPVVRTIKRSRLTSTEVQTINRRTTRGVLESVSAGAALGAAIGSVIPVIGTGVGTVVGAIGGFLSSIFDW